MPESNIATCTDFAHSSRRKSDPRSAAVAVSVSTLLFLSSLYGHGFVHRCTCQIHLHTWLTPVNMYGMCASVRQREMSIGIYALPPVLVVTHTNTHAYTDTHTNTHIKLSQLNLLQEQTD